MKYEFSTDIAGDIVEVKTVFSLSELKDRLEQEVGGYRYERRITERIVELAAEKYLNNNLTEILSKIDAQNIANLATLRASKGIN